MTTLVLMSKKIESGENTKYDMTIFIQVPKRKKLSIKVTGLGWITDSTIDHTISISRNKTLQGSSYIKLSKELDHPRKVLINVQNTDDNQCFKQYLVRYLNPANHNPRKITKANKYFEK